MVILLSDRILWKYWEKLSEQKMACYGWFLHLTNWHCFNTFHTHAMKVKNKRIKDGLEEILYLKAKDENRLY